MSTTRKLMAAEELVLTFILTEGEKSRQHITQLLTKVSSDSFFIAAVCARAMNDPQGEHCKNIICEVFSILKPDQFSNLYEELLKLLTKTQVDTLFLTFANDNVDFRSWIIAQCRKDKNFALLHMLASPVASRKKLDYGNILLIAVNEVPLTDKSRIGTIKNLIKDNTPLSGYYYSNSSLKTFDYAVDLKDYEVIECITEDSFNLDNKTNIAHIANGVARAITDDKASNHCNEVITAVNKKLNPQSKAVFIEALRKPLTQEQANKFFLAHMNDKLPSEFLNLLIDYGINEEPYLRAIETCTDIKNAEVYLNQLLEKKPQTDTLKKAIQKVINRSVTSKDWRLVDILASKILPGNEDIYGDLALTTAKHQKKDILKKLIKANAKLNWYTIDSNERKYALHFMIEHKWNDVIEEMLTNAEGIKLLADGIAQVIINRSDNCIGIIKVVNPLLKDKKVSTLFYDALNASLTKQQADEAFTKHVSDTTWPVLNMLMGYGISPEAIIKNIETTIYNDDCLIYMNNLLEQKLDTSQFEKLMDIAIARSKKHGNWPLVDKIASKQISGNEKIYGKALLEVVKENKPNNETIIQKLIQANAFLNEQSGDKQNTALHLAAERGDCKLTCMLLNAGACTNIKNREQKTPEDLSIISENYYVAALLKSNNREKIIAQQDKYPIPQLNILYRLFIDDPDSLQLILEEDFVCKAKDEKGEFSRTRTEFTRVIFNTVSECKTQAIQDSTLDICTQLLKNNLFGKPASELKETLTYQDSDGNTALHKAVLSGHFDLVKILLDAGSNRYIGNKLGETPLTLAEKNNSLTIARLLKTDPDKRQNLFYEINQYQGGIKKFEQDLQKKEPKIKRTTYKALTSDHIAIQEAINYCRSYYKYGRLIVLSAIGAMYSQLALHLTCYRADITGLKVDDLSWLVHGVSAADKQKLKYLQDFFSSNIEALCEAKNQEKYKDLDPFTLILLVMKQKLKNPTYKQIITKHKIESSIRSIMRDELGMSPDEINQQMDRSHYIIDKILDLKQSEPEQKAGEKQSDLFRAALQGKLYGFRRMINSYYEDTRIADYAKFQLRENLFPRHGRLMLFCAAIAPFVHESDHATYLFYLKSLNPKTMLRSNEKIKVLALMKKFYLYSFEVSKSLKQHYNANDPFMLIFLVLEYASKYKKFSATEIKTINARLKESLNSAMLHEGGYTKIESDNFIIEKETQVAAIVRSTPLEIEDKLQTPIETSDNSILFPVAQTVSHDLLPQPSAPFMALLSPAAAVVVTSPTGASIPPLAQVVKFPESSHEMLPPLAMMPPVAAEVTTEESPPTAMPVAQPEIIIGIATNPSALFSQSSSAKLSNAVMEDLKYLQLREKLLDVPVPPDSSALIEENNVTQPTPTIKIAGMLTG